MARKSKLLRPSLGAKCSCLIRFLHPSAEIKAKILNPAHGQRLSGVVLISQSTRRVNQINQNCYKFCHKDLKNLVIYTPVRWVKFEVEGPENSFFSQQSDISSNSESASSESGSETDNSTVATRLNFIYIITNEVASFLSYLRWHCYGYINGYECRWW